jgi:hypothetical protein
MRAKDTSVGKRDVALSGSSIASSVYVQCLWKKLAACADISQIGKYRRRVTIGVRS